MLARYTNITNICILTSTNTRIYSYFQNELIKKIEFQFLLISKFEFEMNSPILNFSMINLIIIFSWIVFEDFVISQGRGNGGGRDGSSPPSFEQTVAGTSPTPQIL